MAYSRATNFTYTEIDSFHNHYEDVDDYDYDYDEAPYYGAYGGTLAGQQPRALQIDPVTVVAVALILAFIITSLLNQDERTAAVAVPQLNEAAARPVATAAPAPTVAPPAAPEAAGDPAAIIMPYDDYILTQGLHGQSYGHLAIDIKAGEGAIIKSPIEGVVTQLYTDEIGNPTLVIENDVFQVMMLHGIYTVKIGDQVKIGQPVGTESNLGNTRDAWGNSCRGRDCGYHTHLNVFDKRLGTNVNPLEVMGLRLAR